MKKPLLFSILFLIAASAFAQLTVKPVKNNTGDSYIYVKNQILYVQKEINLTKNPTASVEASIYLRDGGQLIQKDAAAKNDGNGFLSVQQISPETNAWAYYDWCSPVGNPKVEDSTSIYPKGNTNFGLQSIYEDRNTVAGTGTKAIKSLNIGSKEGFNDPRITISRRWLYILEEPETEAEANYDRINATNGAPPGLGFTMKGVNNGPADLTPENTTSAPQRYEFRGRPNNGDFKIKVEGPSYTNGSGNPLPATAAAKMTLTGNPYPSALDLNKVYYDSDNKDLSAIFYYDEDREEMSHLYSQKPFGYGVWIPGSGGNGEYVKATFFIWNSGGTHSDNGPTNNRNDRPKRYAPIGQGFRFVGNKLGNVWIKNSHRVFKKEDAESIFFKATANSPSNQETTTQDNPSSNRHVVPEELDTRTPQLRLYIVFDDALTRDMLLLFSDEATDGYDRGFDGLSPGGMKSDAFFPIGPDGEQLPYVIQGTNYNINKQIPITFKLHKPSKIDVRAVAEIKKPYRRAYLFDKQENTYTQLLKTDLASGINLPAGVYEDRFYIVFRNINIAYDIPVDEVAAKEAVLKNVNFFQNNPAKQLEVRNPEGYTLKSAAVYDMAGKLVISEKNLGNNTNYIFYTGNLSDGLYLIKLKTSEDITIDYKVIVHNK